MNKIFLLVALAATAVPSAAMARGTTVAPPGNSAVNQYLENVPTAGGSRPANTIHVGGGVGGGSGGSGGGSSSAVSSNTQRALARQGGDGVAAAALARATAPAVAASTGHGAASTAGAGSTSASSGSRSTAGSPSGSGSSAVGTLVNALTGGSSQGGLGPVLPVILVAAAIAAVALGAVRRRRHQDT
jgi:hypothetical protein